MPAPWCLLLASDACLIAMAFVLASLLRFDFAVPARYRELLLGFLLVLIPLKLGVFAVFGLYLWLREAGGPTYYDKLLCVPFLNLMVRRLDRLGGPPATRANLGVVAAGALGFAVLYGTNFLGPMQPELPTAGGKANGH